MKRILIIEDEAPMADALKYTLEKETFQVDVASDGAEGLRKFEREDYDLLLLDLMLPEVDGFEVCRRVRASSMVPILMLTAKDSDIDEVLGLEIGADDYVTKPFNTRKLIARIKAILRRTADEGGEQKKEITAGGIRMDLAKHEVSLEEQAVHLTPLEYGILEVLMSNKGKALSREFLLNRVWEGDFYGSPKTLDVHIRHLREKLEADAASPRYIKTVRGMGYRFEEPPPDHEKP